MSPRHHQSRFVVLIIPLCLIACSRSAPEARHSSAPSASLRPPSPTTPAASSTQGAVVAYQGMWNAYLDALRNPDPHDPALARYATGAALKTLVAGVREVQDKGLKGEGEFILKPRIEEMEPASVPTKVRIRDCLDTAQSRIVRASHGPAYYDKPGGRRLCIATVERQRDGSWKVISFGLHEVGSCS